MNFIIHVSFFVLLMSHSVALVPFMRKIKNNLIPATEDFGVLSILLYYDIGIVFELFGFEYDNPFFHQFLQADRRSTFISLAILIAAPWLFILGSRLVGHSKTSEPAGQTSAILAKRAPVFYLTMLVVSSVPALIGYHCLSEYNSEIWSLRNDVCAEWGPWIIIFYLPLYFLAFFVRQKNSKTLFGFIMVIFLFIANLLATLSIGQRTNILLPILIISLFTFRITITRMAAICISLVLLAALILPVFKWQYSGTGSSTAELLVSTINTDLSRSQVLAESIERSDFLGSRIMPYPMAGYVYSILFFIPRGLAPFKGYPTASYFTGSIVGADASAIDWGFGVGAIEEIMLNAGILWVLPGLLAYGLLMGALDSLSMRVPSLLVPTRLAPLWMCGYHLPALLLLFGIMGGLCWTCHILFTDRRVRGINGPTPHFYKSVTSPGCRTNISALAAFRPAK